MAYETDTTTPRERRRQARLERILDTAMGLIVEGGFDALSINRLARELDYTPGALYRYFPSKDRLTIELVGLVVREFRAAIATRVGRYDDPLARLVAFALGYKDAALAAPNRFGLIALLLADPRFLVEDASESAPALAKVTEVLKPLASAFVEAQTSGQLRAGDPVKRALALFAGVQGVLQLRKQARFDPPLVDLDGLAREVVGTLLRGWGASPEALEVLGELE